MSRRRSTISRWLNLKVPQQLPQEKEAPLFRKDRHRILADEAEPCAIREGTFEEGNRISEHSVLYGAPYLLLGYLKQLR
jgi:hypothetical protein